MIKQYILEQYPKEACAFEMKDGQVILLQNHSADPNNEFLIHPSDYRQYYQDIRFIIHSHTRNHYPNTTIDPRAPSWYDLHTHFEAGLAGKIYHCDGENVSEPVIFNDDSRIQPLIGRQFCHNANDCFTLTRDFLHLYHVEHYDQLLDLDDVYETRFARAIPNVRRSPDWFIRGLPIFEDFMHYVGFRVVDILLPGDVLFTGTGKRIEHCAIYLGHNEILHHLPGRLSEISSYTDVLKHVKVIGRV